MLEVLAWILFGAIAGWIASLIMKTDAEQGAVGNVLVGVLGAIIGGFVMRLLGGSGVTGFNIGSLLVAILGAVVLLAIVKAFSRRSRV